MNHLSRWICLLGVAALVPVEGRVRDRLDEDDAWYGGDEAARVASNVLAWQTEAGGWPKNVDTTAPRPADAKPRATFDNGATVGELRFLAKMIAATHDDRYEAAFQRGLKHILEAQYDNGGWPQRHPPGDGYARHITLNDGVMARLLDFLREVSEEEGYAFLPSELREEAKRSIDRGIDCLLKCQIVIDGKRTVWCAQHDEKDFRPRGARSYELPSLSASESAGVLRFLMRLPDPTPPIRDAIIGAARWFEESELNGIRLVKKDGDRVLVEDPKAPPLWGRFYDLESGRPFFAGRDGVKKDSIAEIEAERRNGYAWYGSWGESVARDYRKWQERLRRAAVGRGIEFLKSLHDEELGLLPEFEGHRVYWLYHDNYLAAHVLQPHEPELSKSITDAIAREGVREAGKIEIVTGEATDPLPFRHHALVEVRRVNGKILKTERVTNEVLQGWREYADLLCLAAMAKATWHPDEARADFEAAMAMWDGHGLRDKVVGLQERYATYKLALLLLAADAVGAAESFPQREAVMERLLGMQNGAGGWVTDYTAEGTPLGKANVETSSLAIMALGGS